MPSRKSLLNVTSRKKRDTMIAYSNITPANPQGSAAYTQTGGAVMPATQQYIMAWNATARTNNVASSSAGTVYDQATRTATTCFMKGLREDCQVTTSDGLPWQWRRICFTLKGGTLFDTQTTGYVLSNADNQGVKRVVNTAYGSGPVGVIQALLFRGQAGVDWSNLMTAPLDRTKVNIKYDKYRSIRAGNEAGTIRDFKMYHPMNKNLVYDDDENGGKMTTSGFSTESKPGMGDYYVVDCFQPRTGGTASSVLRFEPTATLYWHER